MWHYARGLAFAARKQAQAADREHATFQSLCADAEIKAMDSPFLPARDILAVADEVLAAKSAGAHGDHELLVDHLQKAVAAQDKLPYMEPPYWYYPVRQSLGAALLQSRRAAEAETIFRQDLKAFPRNGWSLYGLAESLRRQGKNAAAESVDREFATAWKNADVKLDLAWY
jgi:tetratricopeptide (TPR) repeat protein